MKSKRLWFQIAFFPALILAWQCLPLQAQDDATTAWQTGMDAQHRGNLDEAIADFTQAIEINPRYAQAYYTRGNVKALKKDLDGAISDYDQAIALAPEIPDAYCNRGLTKYQKGDIDGAITDYNQAIEINPRFAGAYSARGNAKGKEGDLDSAIADYGQAIAINPDDAFSYSSRGSAKTRKGDFDGAIADISKAIEIDPGHAYYYSSRGYAKEQKDDFDGAIADYSRAIEINPKDGYYLERGAAKLGKDDFDGAIADFSEAIEINPKDAANYGCRGDAKRQKGDLEGAIADFNKAIEIDAQYALAYSDRGDAERQKGDLDAAISDYNQSIEIDPQFPYYYYVRGIAKDKKGDHAAAVSDYNKSISLELSSVVSATPESQSNQSGIEKKVEMGTGFFVTATGYLLTDYHVVKHANIIMVKRGNDFVPANLAAKDTVNDIALLKIDGTCPRLPLGDSGAALLGQTVFTVGFPEPQLQGLSPKLTKGEISSLAGMQDDERMFQISLPIQPGNSGGCLVDESGNVVGLVEATLSTLATVNGTGDLLQNVNYATKINYAKTLLDTVQDAKSGLMPVKTVPAPFKDQVKTVEGATVFIIAGS